MPIEIAWTAAPALTVFVLALILTRTEFEVRRRPQGSPGRSASRSTSPSSAINGGGNIVYDEYDDQDLGFITANELHVPASDDGVARPVYLTLKSADVCHSFWVPRLAGKTDLIPGRTNQMWFQTDAARLVPRPVRRVLRYPARQHAARVNVDSPADFQSWLENQKKPAVERARSACRREMRSWRSRASIAIASPAQRARGTYAPDLTHLMSRQTIAAGMTPNTPRGAAQMAERSATDQGRLPDAPIRFECKRASISSWTTWRLSSRPLLPVSYSLNCRRH